MYSQSLNKCRSYQLCHIIYSKKITKTVKWSQTFVSLTQLCSLMNPIKALDLSHIISKGAIQIISRCEALFHRSPWTEFSYILTCLSSRFESVHYF